jgi:hypothetical protein
MMVVESDNFWWQDTNCLAPEVQHEKVATICQYDQDDATTTATTPQLTTATETSPVKSCPVSWEEFEDNCYQYRTNKEEWSAANTDCILAGGHLASIHSLAENDFIVQLSGLTEHWLGSTNFTSEVRTFNSCAV